MEDPGRTDESALVLRLTRWTVSTLAPRGTSNPQPQSRIPCQARNRAGHRDSLDGRVQPPQLVFCSAQIGS